MCCKLKWIVWVLLMVACTARLQGAACYFTSFGQEPGTSIPVTIGSWFATGPIWSLTRPGENDVAIFDSDMFPPRGPHSIWLGDYWYLDFNSEWGWNFFPGNLAKIDTLRIRSGGYSLLFNPNMADPLPELPRPVNNGGLDTRWISIEGGYLNLYGLGCINLPDASKASVVAQNLYVNGSGAVTIGQHAVVVLSNGLVVGNTGGGVLKIEDAGAIFSSWCGIAEASGSSGLVTVTGASSTWSSSNSIFVGRSGSGILQIEAGGTVTTGGCFIGERLGGTGSVTIKGRESTWSNSNWLGVGQYGNGTLRIEAGGTVISEGCSIGYCLGGTGLATVTGAGSTWTNSSSLSLGAADISNGTLRIEDGGTVTSDGGYIGLNSGSTGLVTVTGASSTLSSNSLFVGRFGSGILQIEAGGRVTTGWCSIGERLGGTGLAVVTGTGSTWTISGGHRVGESGKGTLRIEDGGKVTGTWSYIARSGSTGQVTVTGIGSTWSNSDFLVVGHSGTGTLRIEAGGTVTSNGGEVGSELKGTGSVTVIGIGSTWTNSNGLTVFGNGTLRIEDGGRVTDTWSYIGDHSGSAGVVMVTGIGSTWTNSNGLMVGCCGNGTLRIEDGGTVTSNGGEIGSLWSSIGQVTVTGIGSTWTNSDWLTVFGTGSLRIEAGGAASILQSMQIKEHGIVDVANHGRIVVGNAPLASVPDSSILIASGGMLTNSGTITGNVVVKGGTILSSENMASSPNTLGLQSLALDTTVSGSTLRMKVGMPTAAEAVGDRINVTAANGFTITPGTNKASVAVDFYGAPGITPGPWRFPLIIYSGIIGGRGLEGLQVLTSPRVVASLDDSSGASVDLLVSAINYPRWTGANGGTWDTAGTVNWNEASSGNPTTYLQDDSADLVIFDDAADVVSNTATLVNTVEPLGVLVNNSVRNYTIAGPGKISGEGGITKLGTGKLTLSTNDNDFSGGLRVLAGTVQIGDGGTNGSLGVFGSVVNNAELIFDRSDSLDVFNEISGTGTLTQAGTGTLTLMGLLSYTGDTKVDAGTLTIVGSVDTPLANVYVANAANLNADSIICNSLQIGTASANVNREGGESTGPTNWLLASNSVPNENVSNGVGLTAGISGPHNLNGAGGTLPANSIIVDTRSIATTRAMAVPEPSTLALLSFGAVGMFVLVRRRYFS